MLHYQIFTHIPALEKTSTLRSGCSSPCRFFCRIAFSHVNAPICSLKWYSPNAGSRTQCNHQQAVKSLLSDKTADKELPWLHMTTKTEANAAQDAVAGPVSALKSSLIQPGRAELQFLLPLTSMIGSPTTWGLWKLQSNFSRSIKLGKLAFQFAESSASVVTCFCTLYLLSCQNGILFKIYF